MKIKEGVIAIEPLNVGDKVYIFGEFTAEEVEIIGWDDEMYDSIGYDTVIEEVSFNRELGQYEYYCSNGYYWPEHMLYKTS